MAELRPFRPLRYDPARVGELAAVLAPPYDVISPEGRNALYARSEFNVVRLILNRAADPYADAADTLRQWRRDGVLVRDRQAAIGFHVETFRLPDGSTRRREGLLGIVRAEPFDTGRIRPHERTFAGPKADRMRLLRACRTNLSPIFGLLAQPPSAIDPARTAAAQRSPDVQVRDDTGVEHRLWLLTDKAVTGALSAALADEPVIIADGHHRYETALAYAEQCRAAGAVDADAPSNFVLMYLTSMRDPGLVVLPTHRVFAAGIDPAALLTQVRQHFAVEAFPRTAVADFRARLHAASGQEQVGLVLSGRDDLFVVTLDNETLAQRYAAAIAPVVRRLDVTVLDTVILRGLLGIDCVAAGQDGRLFYTHADDEAISAVEKGAQAAFLMNAPRLDDVQAVCSAGETMPQKSTYFYPKLLTGLVFHPFDD